MLSTTSQSTPDILTPTEVATLLRIGRSSVYKLLNSGALASFRIGKKIIIPKNAIDTYIEQKMSYNSSATNQINRSLS